jgi:hypothetical protein
MVKRTIICFLVWLVVSVVQAQDAAQPFAAVTDGVLGVYGLSQNPLIIDNPSNQGFRDMVWSPDGQRLAYLLVNDYYEPQLMVTNTSGGPPINLNTGGIEAGFPVTFSADGHLLYIGRGELPGADSHEYQVSVRRITPDEAAQPETLGSFAMKIGCGGGSPLPGDWRYWDEAGFGGNYLILRMTEYGLLHSTGCGGLGLALLDLESGRDTPIGPDLFQQQGASEGYGRASLAPDGQHLAAVYTRYAQPIPERSLVVIDLATLTATPVATAEQPDQISWGMDGTLFYSVISFKENLVNALTDAEKQKLSETNTLDIPGHDVIIHHVNPATGEDRVIYRGEGYAIGRMAASADGTALILSQIASLRDWITAIADGRVDVLVDSNGKAQRALVPVALFQLKLGSSTGPTLLGDNLAQFVLKPT